MKQVSIADLNPGMVLASEVRGNNGRLLLERGQVLEDRHFRVLNMWGVVAVFIEEPPSADLSKPSADVTFLAEAEAYVQQRFGPKTPENEEIAELRRQCSLLTAKRLAEGWKPLPFPEDTRDLIAKPSTQILTLEALTSDDKGLASLPDIYFQINRALDDPACTATRLADIISKDTGLSAKLLRLVNSPAIGQGRKVDTLTRGVVMLGTREISQLALGVAVMDQFKNLPKGGLPVVEFWKHSLACGVFARLLAMHIKRKDLERFFVAGMLHDIGRLVMVRLAPTETWATIALAHDKGLPLYTAEREVFGFDHCDVARHLTTRWLLPEALSNIIAAHHSPELCTELQEASVLNVADALAIAFEFGHSGQYLFTGMEQSAWLSLGLPPAVMGVILVQAQRQLDDIFAIFLG